MSDFTVIKPGENLSRIVASVLSSTKPGAFGAVLRGLLVACTAVESREDQWGYKQRALAELIENAAVYAERNKL